MPERCYLSEALYWIAFNRFPVASYTRNGIDVREDPDEIEGFEQSFPFEEIVSASECAYAGLPVNPEWVAMIEGNYSPSSKELERILRMTTLSEKERSSYSKSLDRALEAEKNLAEWEEEFEAFIELHRAKLFLALREGRLKATGRKLDKPTIEEAFAEYQLADNWKDFAALPWEEIPARFWSLDDTAWYLSQSHGRKHSYCLILIELDDLLEVFPEGEGIKRLVTQIGDALILADDEEPHRKNPRGRPPFDWDALHVEMAARIKEHGLPAKQEAFIAEMQEWFEKRWKKQIGRSTLLQKIRPYYKRLNP